MIGLKSNTGLPRRLIFWIDGVGGYLICLSPEITIGQATPDSDVDVPLFADISRKHVRIVRDTEGYLLEALRPIAVNEQDVDKAFLRDGDKLKLGSGCEVKFRQPAAVSPTARLELTSKHRLSVAVDSVILMGDTCIIGPTRGAHIEVPDLDRSLVVFRKKDGLGIQSPGSMLIDGKRWRDRAALTTRSTVDIEDFRLTLEQA